MANNLGVLDGCVVAKKSLQECHPVASVERHEGDFPQLGEQYSGR